MLGIELPPKIVPIRKQLVIGSIIYASLPHKRCLQIGANAPVRLGLLEHVMFRFSRFTDENWSLSDVLNVVVGPRNLVEKISRSESD